MNSNICFLFVGTNLLPKIETQVDGAFVLQDRSTPEAPNGIWKDALLVAETARIYNADGGHFVSLQRKGGM